MSTTGSGKCKSLCIEFYQASISYAIKTLFIETLSNATAYVCWKPKVIQASLTLLIQIRCSIGPKLTSMSKTAIHNQRQTGQMRRDIVSGPNNSFASLNIYDTFSGLINILTSEITTCVDSNTTGINDIDSITNYVLKQTEIDPIIAWQGSWNGAQNISCPDFKSHNPEKLPTVFPKNIRDQIIITARQYDFGFPMNGTLNTYNFVGARNAAVFVHNSYARGVMDDRTMNVMKSYFGEGT